MFLISWRSAVPEIAASDVGRLPEIGPLKAIDVVREITGAERDACARLLRRRNDARLRRRRAGRARQDKLATVTLLTTMLDFSDTGEIGLLIDEGYGRAARGTIGNGGILPARNLRSPSARCAPTI